MNTEELSVGYTNVVMTEQESSTEHIKALEDIHSIEAAIAIIKKINTDVSSYKELKKKRVNHIDAKIQFLTRRQDLLKSIILSTLNENDEKIVNFPGIGKVSKRKKKGIWTVQDEKLLFDFLKEEKEYDNIVEDRPTIKKSELNKLLEDWKDLDKIPNCVIRTDDAESVTITFEKSFDTDIDLDEIPIPKKSSLKDLDALEF